MHVYQHSVKYLLKYQFFRYLGLECSSFFLQSHELSRLMLSEITCASDEKAFQSHEALLVTVQITADWCKKINLSNHAHTHIAPEYD